MIVSVFGSSVAKGVFIKYLKVYVKSEGNYCFLLHLLSVTYDHHKLLQVNPEEVVVGARREIPTTGEYTKLSLEITAQNVFHPPTIYQPLSFVCQ